MSEQPTVSAYDPIAGEILDDASDALSNVLTGMAEHMASRRGDSVVRVQDVQEAVSFLLSLFSSFASPDVEKPVDFDVDEVTSRLRELLEQCQSSAMHA